MNPRSRTVRWSLCLAGLSLAWLPGQADAAKELEQKDLVQKRDAKQKKEVFQLAKWSFDYDAARAEAKRTGKPIFAYFTRSYAPCGSCDALESGALADAQFPRFAAGVVLFAHITSRVDGEPHPDLLRQQGFVSFPSLCFLDHEGNRLVVQGERSVPAFAATLARLRRVADLRQQIAAGGGAPLQRELFFLELELQSLDAAAIAQRIESLHLDAADRARADEHLVDAEVRALRVRQRELGGDGVAAAIAAMAREGRRPTAGGATTFWQTVLMWGSKHGDVVLAQAAFDALAPLPQAAAVKKRYADLLEQAKAAARKDEPKKDEPKKEGATGG